MSMPGHSRNFNQERAVECKRLVEELKDFSEAFYPNEEKFITDLSESFDKYGENTRVSDKQYSWLSSIYERIIG